jgi:S1-C subfamily serine protease
MFVQSQVLKTGAIVFVLAMAAHSAGIIYYNRNGFPTGTIGAVFEPPDDRREMRIARITPGGPADRAGLRRGDRIRGVNGRTLTTSYPFWDAVDRGAHLEIR